MEQTLNERLRRQQALENQADKLVSMAQKTLDAKMSDLRRGRGLKTAQFNNLLGVALETPSPAVVINWLSYQMGRRTPDTRPWKDSGLGEQVVADIKALKARAESVAKDNTDEAEVRELHIQLTRKYLGYLKRWFVAKGGR